MSDHIEGSLPLRKRRREILGTGTNWSLRISQRAIFFDDRLDEALDL